VKATLKTTLRVDDDLRNGRPASPAATPNSRGGGQSNFNSGEQDNEPAESAARLSSGVINVGETDNVDSMYA